MRVLRRMLSLLFLTLAIAPITLHAMDNPVLDEKKCLVCRTDYHHDIFDSIIGFEKSCNHSMCPDCFLSTGAVCDNKRAFECDLCNQKLYLEIEKTCNRSPHQEIFDSLCEALDSNLGFTLIKSIKTLADNFSVECASSLLKSAYSNTGKSICQVYDGENVLHHAVCNKKIPMKCIDIILTTAQHNAWDLVCTQTSFLKTTPLGYIVESYFYYDCPSVDYGLEAIKKLLSVAPSDEERWHLITRVPKNLDGTEGMSILQFAQTCEMLRYNPNSERLSEIVTLLQSYQPKTL